MAAQLVPLSPQKVADASRSLATAFFDDPTSRFQFPREESRDRWLRLIHRAGLRHVLPEGHVYAVSGDETTGVIGLVPPGRYPLSTARYLRYLLPIALRLPTGGFPPERALRAVQAQGLIDRLHIKEPHWYVFVLGVCPERQGEGLGRALLGPALARADRDRLPTYLETTKERNLTFYGRFGFEVVQEVSIPGGGPPVWTMLRQPVG